MFLQKFSSWTWIAILFLGVMMGCVESLKVKEVLEGSDALVQELTQDMEITVLYPEGEVRLHEPYDIVIRLENHGQYEPRLNTVMVRVRNEQEGLQCQITDPAPVQEDHRSLLHFFYLPPQKVARGGTTEIHMQCVFNQPGIYKLLLSADFRESGIAFVSQVLLITAK